LHDARTVSSIGGTHAWRTEIDVVPGLLRQATYWQRRLSTAARIAVISDRRVAGLYLKSLTAILEAFAPVDAFVVAPGERSKSRTTKARIEDRMFAAGFGRDAWVVALGGGVVGDLAGYVAATYMRGLPVIQAPTSLVAMVDSALGGKTGIDVPAGKNLVGAFHPPRVVAADVTALQTLADAQLRYGLAEVVKHGVIADAALLAFVEAQLPAIFARREDVLRELVAWNLAIKGRVVEQDEREGDLRQILNFGHTVGHALERLARYRLPHGEAVGLGMVVEARLAERCCGFPASDTQRVTSLLSRIGLPTALPPAYTPAAVLAAMQTDKKTRAGRVRYALPRQLGEMARDPHQGYGRACTEADVRVALVAARKN